MRQAIRAARDEHECDDVENAQARPHGQRWRHVGLVGDGIDDAAEKNRLGDGDDREEDVGATDDRNLPRATAR